MGLWVQKYGGTSVASPERIRAVADRIVQFREQGHQLVIVVSAMGHATDELIALAHQVSDSPAHREMDMLLSTGERISMALLSMALWDRGVAALSLTGSQSGIITEPHHRRARIIRILGNRVRAGLDSGHVVIVAGFQGVSEAKEITTLGRGGSDTTAVALAATLNAEGCEIYTDVDGVYSADPRVVPQARLWSELSYRPMVAMACHGAGVLHSRCVQLAQRYGVRLIIKNSMKEGEGTIVSSKPMEQYAVNGVTADAGKALVSVEMTRPSVISSLWDRSAEAHLVIGAPWFSEKQVYFFIERDSADEWRKILSRLATDGFVTQYQIDEGTVPLTVVGERFTQDGRALGEIFDTLAKAGITARLGTTSPISVTVAVPATHAEDGVRELHRLYMESTQENAGDK